jgi:NAD(P)-dependent dehydrogenase (short-subunit alcohol dehydrogenase family)
MDGKVAFVSGGAGGLGTAICRQLAAKGVRVAIAEIDHRRAEELASEIATDGGTAAGVELDATSSTSVQEAFGQVIEDFGHVDFLIHAAGTEVISPLLELAEQDWRSVLDTHLTAAFLLCQAFGHQIVHQGEGGRVVLLSSVAARTPVPDRGAYSPAKAGLVALAQMLSLEWAQHNINVNAICPGVTSTPMAKRIYELRPELRTQRLRRFPMGREALPDEIADLALFLCSNNSTYINGTAITIDGGFLNSGFMPESA